VSALEPAPRSGRAGLEPRPAGRGHGSPRLVLLGIVALFLVPVVAAWLLAGPGARWGGATVNRGTLLAPLELAATPGLRALDGEPLGEGYLRGRWTLIEVAGDGCASECEGALYALRQTRRALGRKMDRVQRLLLIEAGAGAAAALRLVGERYPGTRVAAPTRGWLARLSGDRRPGGIYLLDPRGFRVLYYPSGVDPRDILRDLERLLKADDTD